MNVGIENGYEQFLFWEYLFKIFGTVSLQCRVFKFKKGLISVSNLHIDLRCMDKQLGKEKN
jgi:hypothetical protein